MPHFPGFDTGSYPGDRAMTAWAQAGLYKWCGFYLTSPRHSDQRFTPYTGKAQFLQSLGLGLAVLYVGFQQNTDSSSQLTPANGKKHGLDAVAKCQQEGLPNGTTLFLDVEHFDGVMSPSFTGYYRGWLSSILDSQVFQPGTYCAAANFSSINSAAQKEYAAHGMASDGPAIWIVRVFKNKVFNATSADPTDCGIAQANIWQGLLDTSQTQGGVQLRVDLNTADSDDPSRSKPDATPISIESDTIMVTDD